MIDFRSDTVTKPTPEMLDAMLHAEVGDDVFGDDPTVNELEDMVASMLGHEAGLFCPSGTMTNQIAIQVHTKPGDEVICHESSHVYNYEGGGIARNALSSVKLIRNDHYAMSATEIEALINDDQDWLARTSLVVAEDTSNRGGGKCYDLENLKSLSAYCKSQQLGFHLDGARVFNAIVKNKHNIKKYGQLFDSISICLSKGLGAPVGSVLIGKKDFIKESRRVRKVMGGGMRQSGILAAAGIYAINHNVAKLEKDHYRAKQLAALVNRLGKVVFVIPPETNILIFDVLSEIGEKKILEKLDSHGLRAVAFGKNRIRIVTHLGITDGDIAQAESILKNVLS